MPTNESPASQAHRALWHALSRTPSEVSDTNSAVATDSTVRALLYWNDRGNLAPDEYGSAADCRLNLIRQIAQEDACELFDKAQAHFAATCGASDDDDGATLARADELACLIDPARADEARDMVDDWEARLGLPDDLADELRALIVDNFHVFQRG